jgi:hypothetical protein
MQFYAAIAKATSANRADAAAAAGEVEFPRLSANDSYSSHFR